MSKAVLQAGGVTMSYGDKRVLGGLDLTVNKGEICGLLGPNGAGKTTLLKIITGMIRPARGEIRLFGEAFQPGLLRRTGCMIDRPGLYGNRTAAENLRMRQALLGIPENRVPEILEQVGLGDAGKKHVSRFSQGMKQRLAIGMALMGNPDLLILDEPVNGLDARGMYDIRTLLTALCRDRGVTVLITSHLLDEVARIASCYAFLQNGVVRQMSGEDVREKSRRYAEIITGDDQGATVVLDRFVTGEKDYEAIPGGGIRLYEALDSLADINAALVEAGVPVHTLALKTQTLADFYLSETETGHGSDDGDSRKQTE